MHTPNPGSEPRPAGQDDDTRQPPVPPDQENEIVPIEEPPKTTHGDPPPKIVERTRAMHARDGPSWLSTVHAPDEL